MTAASPAVLPDPQPSRRSRILGALSRREWSRLAGMAGFIIALHVVGWFTLVAIVAPQHYSVGTKSFGIGIGVTAYTLGMRHAFDADHIAAIDNTTRKLMDEGKRPLSVGFWFSLGHSSVVFGLALLLVARRQGAGRAGRGRRLAAAQRHRPDRHHRLRRLPLPDRASINLVDPGRHLEGLPADARAATSTRPRWRSSSNNRGPDEPDARPGDAVDHQAVADVPGRPAVRARLRHRHRGRAAGAGRLAAPPSGLPWYAILCLPVLFAAGMSPAGHHRRLVHELRLRLGLLQAGPQGLLQPHHHRPVGRGRADHRHRRAARPARRPARPAPARSGTGSAASTSTSSASSSSACSSSPGSSPCAVWKFGRIEEKWSAGLRPAESGE